MTTWKSFAEMRGDHEPREWMRWSEFLAAVLAEIPCLGVWDIRQAVRRSTRPEKRYGHYRYTNEHMDAVRAYAARMGLTKETTHV